MLSTRCLSIHFPKRYVNVLGLIALFLLASLLAACTEQQVEDFMAGRLLRDVQQDELPGELAARLTAIDPSTVHLLGEHAGQRFWRGKNEDGEICVFDYAEIGEVWMSARGCASEADFARRGVFIVITSSVVGAEHFSAAIAMPDGYAEDAAQKLPTAVVMPNLIVFDAPEAIDSAIDQHGDTVFLSDSSGAAKLDLELSLAALVAGRARVQADVQIPRVITGSESHPRVAVYHPDSQHLWNRLFAHFYVRLAPDGTAYGEDMLEPLLWPETTYLLEGSVYEQALELLDEFLAQDEETWLGDPLKRAFMQRDLWAVFDWTTLATTYPAERRALQERLAATIQRLALTRAEIEALPDSYQAAVASGLFPTHYQAGNVADSDLRGDAYLPPDLLRVDGEWFSLGRENGPMAMWHTSRYPFLGRSAFLIYAQLPDGLEATAEYVSVLRALEEPGDGPQPPVGAEFALVRRMMLIDNRGEIVVSPLVEKVQLQRRDVRSPSDSVSYEFKLERERLFSGESGGLRAVTVDDLEVPLLNAHALEWFFAGESQDILTPTLPAYPVLERCADCHTYGVRSILSVSGHRFGLPDGERIVARDTTPAREAEFALAWKREHDSWLQLASQLQVVE